MDWQCEDSASYAGQVARLIAVHVVPQGAALVDWHTFDHGASVAVMWEWPNGKRDATRVRLIGA